LAGRLWPVSARVAVTTSEVRRGPKLAS
jgi:hypothetical protein